MKKIIPVIILAAVFICTFFLIFFTGNGKPDGTNDPTDTDNTPYNYDLKEYITLGSFPEVTIDEAEIEKIVDDNLKQLASNFAEKKEVTDRAIKNGDTANIDYVGTLDGVAFEGGTAQGADLVIGSGSFIPGFEDGLIGHNIGEEVKLDLTFPTDYRNKEMAGKTVVFTVKINKITESILPELTDTMVQALNMPDCQTVAAFEQYVRKHATDSVIWESYIESCSVIKYPEAQVEKYTDNIIANYTAQAKYYNTDLASLVSVMGFSGLEQFKTYAKETAEQSVKAEMTVYRTVRDNGITVSDGEYKTLGLTVAKENNYDSLEKMEEAKGKDYIMLSVYQLKIIDMVRNEMGIK